MTVTYVEIEPTFFRSTGIAAVGLPRARSDLGPLRDHPRFQALLARYEN